MSYDLYLLKVPPGVDARQAVQDMLVEQERSLDDEEQNGHPVALDEEQRGAVERLTKSVLAKHANLERYEFDYAEIGRSMGISEAEARRQNAHIELNDELLGIQITLWGDTASISMPFWHEGEAAKSAFAKMCEYVACLEQYGGYRTWDPQTGDFMDIQGEIDAVGRVYSGGVQALRAAVKSGDRRWWEFWKRSR